MNILITGAYGQLANELTQILKSGSAEIGKIPEEYDNAQVTAVDMDKLDITDCDGVFEMVSSVQPDLIINCAAMTNVNACESDFETAMKANAFGPRNLAMAADEFDAKIVHISTDYVFAGDGTVPYCEWDLTAPKTAYGKSKEMGEKYLVQQCGRYFIFRTSWLYGLVGNNFVKTMINLAKTKDEVKVVNDQRGNPTNANDLAYHILKVATTEGYGIYHCTGEGECTWYDLAKESVSLMGMDGNIIQPCTTDEFPSPAPRPAFSSLNNLALSTTVGNEMRQWKTALKSYIKKLQELEK